MKILRGTAVGISQFKCAAQRAYISGAILKSGFFETELCIHMCVDCRGADIFDW